MTLYKPHIKDFQNYFARLSEDEQNAILRSFADQHNEDLHNNVFVNLSFAPRWNLRRPKYTGTCHCGHSSSRHWFLNSDFKECKQCDCEGFYE